MIMSKGRYSGFIETESNNASSQKAAKCSMWGTNMAWERVMDIPRNNFSNEYDDGKEVEWSIEKVSSEIFEKLSSPK